MEVDEKLIPGIPELSPFAPEVMRWRLLDLFRSAEFQNGAEFEDVRNVLQDYLGSGESADYQLAGQLADIFDQYLVYRPQWIDAWQQGRILGLGDDEIWQSKLWRYLDDGRQSAPHRVALWEKLLAALDKDKLPERYFVFGISTMADVFAAFAQAVRTLRRVRVRTQSERDVLGQRHRSGANPQRRRRSRSDAGRASAACLIGQAGARLFDF